ncbi:MAG: PP2C family protein-serine/threonine phosphatase [Pseudonocardiaceae bacterium]
MIDVATALVVLSILFILIILAVTGLSWYFLRRSQPDDSPLSLPGTAAESDDGVDNRDLRGSQLPTEGAVNAGPGSKAGLATSLHQTQELPEPSDLPALSAAPHGAAGQVVPLRSVGPAGQHPASALPAAPSAPPVPPAVPAAPSRSVPIAEPDPVPAVLSSSAELNVRAVEKLSRSKRVHTLGFDSTGETSPGPRLRNDDTWLVRPHLLVIADGVGGKPAGKTAADLAVRTLRDTVDTRADSPEQELVSAVELAHYTIVKQSRRDPAKAEMACTLDAATLDPKGRVTGAHVGDSRVYYYRPRDGQAVLLTTDEAVEGALLQSLGGVTTQVQPRTWQRSAQVGDRLVLATDGLWSALPDNAVTGLIEGTGKLSPTAAAQVLVNTGVGAGATDNVTVVVADVVAIGP